MAKFGRHGLGETFFCIKVPVPKDCSPPYKQSVVCSSSFSSCLLSWGLTLFRQRCVDVCFMAAGQLAHLPAVNFDRRHMGQMCRWRQHLIGHLLPRAVYLHQVPIWQDVKVTSKRWAETWGRRFDSQTECTDRWTLEQYPTGFKVSQPIIS